jgi:hypothetical protein
VTMDNTLSWNNRIDLLMKKLSTAWYIIRNAKTHMSASSSKMIYHAFFHLAMSYGIIFWGNLSHSSTIVSIQKRQLELWKDVRIEFHAEIYLRNYEFCLWYHNIDTRQRNNLWGHPTSLSAAIFRAQLGTHTSLLKRPFLGPCWTPSRIQADQSQNSLFWPITDNTWTQRTK